jgi:PAS domain-containing protein
MSKTAAASPLHVKRYAFLLIAAWTAISAGLLVWVVNREHREMRERAQGEARAHFNRDRAFGRGEKEDVEFTQIGGEPYLRLMQPMVAEQSCPQCHSQQGYRVGDIRGGASIALPMAPLLAEKREEIAFFSISFAAVWLLGLAAIACGAICIDRRVREHNRYEERLEQNEYYLSRAQKMGSMGTWELDVVKNVLVWTDENYKVFGVPLGTPLNFETFLNCVHPDDREFVRRKWTAGMNREPYDIEHRLLVDGKVKWVREKAELIHDANGNIVKAIGFTQDITERKQVEAEREGLIEKLGSSPEFVGKLRGYW